MQPFAKNMAVEFAAKALPDGELAQALDTLQEAIDGKIGFDGDIKCIYVGPGNFGIPGNLNLTGLYRLISPSNDTIVGAVAIVSNYDNYQCAGFTYRNIFKGVTSIANNFNTDENLFGTKLYKHAIRLSGSKTVTGTFYSITKEPYTSLATFFYEVEQFKAIGYLNISGTTEMRYNPNIAFNAEICWNGISGPNFIRYRTSGGGATVDLTTGAITYPAYEDYTPAGIVDTVTAL